MSKPLTQVIAQAPVLVAPPAVWQAPVPLEEARHEPFPIEAFPPVLARFIIALAAATETPVEMAALIVVAVVATTIAGRCQIRMGAEHFEPLNVFVMAIMEPGNRKSAVIGRAQKPLVVWERRQALALAPVIQEAEILFEIAMAEVKALRKSALAAEPADRAELLAQIRRAMADLPKVPVVPRLLTADVTPERLADLMEAQGERMAIFSDEAGFLGNLGGRYSRGVPNLDVALQGYSVAPLRVDRMNRPPLLLRSPALTIAITPQPAVLQDIDASMMGRGLLDRFMFVVPTSRVGYRTLDDHPIPPGVEQDYVELVDLLLDIPQDLGPDGLPRPFTLSLSQDARGEFRQFSLVVEKAMQPGGMLEHAKGWASKLPGNVGRLAGLLHVSKHAGREPWSALVSKDTMAEAVAIGVSLIPHAKKAYGLVGADPALAAAQDVWAWVKRERRQTFSARDAFNALKARYRQMNAIRPAFTVLEEHNYIREVLQEIPRRGRPASPLYEVSPHAMGGTP